MTKPKAPKKKRTVRETLTAAMTPAQETENWRARALRAESLLATHNTELFETQAKLDQAWRAHDTEAAFWRKEVERLQQLVVDARISAAVKK
jgi:hypothetical protein